MQHSARTHACSSPLRPPAPYAPRSRVVCLKAANSSTGALRIQVRASAAASHRGAAGLAHDQLAAEPHFARWQGGPRDPLQHERECEFADLMRRLAQRREWNRQQPRVPEDIRLVGIDDVEYARLLPVPLSTLRQPTHQTGELALALMLERIARPTLPPREVRLGCELIVRESCGAAMARGR